MRRKGRGRPWFLLFVFSWFMASSYRINFFPVCALPAVYWHMHAPMPGRGAAFRFFAMSAACLMVAVPALFIAHYSFNERRFMSSASALVYPLTHDLLGIAYFTGDMEELAEYTHGAIGSHDFVKAVYADAGVHSARHHIQNNGIEGFAVNMTNLARIKAVWEKAVFKHPGALLRHKWALAGEYLGFSSKQIVFTYPTIDPNPFGLRMGEVSPARAWLHAWLYNSYGRPRGSIGMWAGVFSLAAAGLALRHKQRDPLWLYCLAGTLAYLLINVAICPAPDMRYNLAGLMAAMCAAAAAARPPARKTADMPGACQ
jgi:hypothetical protein